MASFEILSKKKSTSKFSAIRIQRQSYLAGHPARGIQRETLIERPEAAKVYTRATGV